eukprot:gene13343-15695_t
MSLFDNLNDTTNSIGSFLEQKMSKGVNNVMLKIRTAVSKDKNRFINDEFNLDLTYVTNRIIETSYRNSRVDVRRFLDTYHADKYLVLNLTETDYDASYFCGRVHHLGFPDHHPPSLGLLLYSVQIVHNWLSQDPENIIAIHCAAGRGRSGTLICSYLVSTMEYEDKVADVLNLFAQQRSSIGEGITVPSQQRYVHYINALSTRRVDISLAQSPRVLSLKAILMRPIPRSTNGWKPTIEVVCTNMPLKPIILFSNRDPQSAASARSFNQRDPAAFIDTGNVMVCGDIMILTETHGWSKDQSSDSLKPVPIKPSDGAVRSGNVQIRSLADYVLFLEK